MVKACGNGTYGPDCSVLCGHCLNQNDCHYVNGSCLTGCNTGFQGKFCNSSKFAENCFRPFTLNLKSNYNVGYITMKTIEILRP